MADDHAAKVASIQDKLEQAKQLIEEAIAEHSDEEASEGQEEVSEGESDVMGGDRKQKKAGFF